MGSQHTDRTFHQLRGDVYGLYDVAQGIKDDVIKCDRVVRDVHLRLGRLGRTSGRQFGLLLTAQHEHGHRLDRVESHLRDLTTGLDKLAPLPAQVSTLTTQVNELTGRVDQLTNRVDQLTNRVDQLTNRVDQLTGGFDQLTNQVGELTSRVDQLTNQVGELAALPARFVTLETQMGNLQAQVNQLEGTIHQNSRTLDTVLELLRKQQPARRRDELEPPF
ncbi:family 25 glycosyl transferase [Nocardia brasiliensis]|uniref:Family 25 glycosyl transferase n=1 Tax=Nocardia brasiliensis (strain ATCC 700358 / HUJEG-1) TaxID=1133849 RepID=K0EI44_NOCB7|nr:family 25 glycosyl transferase [Nocardia brasiliensis]AFT99017.1 family 25 glycosyl transferase [Nocardia brasiliensis ATCC 700358]OCF87189.1 hypothetical protein AW168_27465 [Nocardia brasiliensis]